MGDGEAFAPSLDRIKDAVLDIRVSLKGGELGVQFGKSRFKAVISFRTNNDMLGGFRLATSRAVVVVLKIPFDKGGANTTVMGGMLGYTSPLAKLH